jgi:penicillin-binding protein 1A
MRCCANVGGPADDLLPLDAAVLGANEATTLEMASAYGTLANAGMHATPLPVATVTDALGNVVWQAEPEPSQVISPEVAAAADGILQDAVLYGTGNAANIGRPQIGKTGTDDEHDNAWFVGSVPQLTAAVWIGFHQGQIPMEPPRTRISVLGGTWPAQIWRLLMLKATEELPADPFPTPEVRYLSIAVDVTQKPYCLPNAYTLPQNVEVLPFIAGTEPGDVCSTPTSLESVIVPSVVGLSQDQATTTLESGGFYVSLDVAASTQPPGTVLYQTPTGGTDALQTSTVMITLAKDPALQG